MTAAPHPFTLRQLQYAVAVADALSFRRAAERCHVSQPSLSAQIAQLEDVLGVRLFERDRRRVLVTAAGDALLGRFRRTLAEADDLLSTARGLGDPLAGTVRVGVIPTISPYLLPAVAPALREALPRLACVWAEDRTEALVGALRRGELDGAILAREADLADLATLEIAEDPFVLATPVGHPLADRGRPASIADLRGTPVLLLDDGHCLRDQALAVCRRGRAQELGFRATSLATLSQMVAAGAGVTLLPALAVPVETARAALVVRPLRDPAPHRTIVLAHRATSPRLPALREIARAARAAYPGARPAPPRATPRPSGAARRR